MLTGWLHGRATRRRDDPFFAIINKPQHQITLIMVE
jgi:hypothetical protein